MTGDQFSAVLGTDKTTVSKWENDEQDRGERADLLIRAVVMALGEGLSQYSERVVRGFPAIEGVWRELRYEIDPEARTCDYVS
jgi:transcriptional regulator with XRE-family HTH domain